MADTTSFDAIIVGAGQAGKPLALDLAGRGWSVALVERDQVGGTCINVGCTPTKTMVASARVAWLAGQAGRYGVATGPVRVDLAAVRERKRAIVRSFRGGSEARIAQTPLLQLIRGEARFLDSGTLEVALKDGGTRHLTAPRIVLNSGCRPAPPRLPGLETIPWLDSTSIMELDRVPEHLLVIGGGYIGLEFGQMFHRFGSRVTVIQRGERLLGREDDDVAEAVRELLVAEGLEIRLDTNPVSVTRGAAGGLELTIERTGVRETITGTHLLAAAGRTPNTERLNLAAAGLIPDKRGFIPVNTQLETAVPRIFALGDVNGGPAFTHISYDDYRILRDSWLGGGHPGTAGRLLPYTVFLDPQLGRVGLTEADARATGRPITVKKIPMTYVARALETDDTRGFMKAVVDTETDKILGAAVLGMEGGEVMAMIQLAMMGGLTATQLYNGVFAHPTLSEALNTLFAPGG